MTSPAPIDFAVRGDHITLDALLKVCGLVPSGGAAKTAIAAGEVVVDGVVELRKTRKLRPGAEVRFAGECIRILAEAGGKDAANDASS